MFKRNVRKDIDNNKVRFTSVDKSLTFSLLSSCLTLFVMVLCFLTTTWAYFSDSSTVTLASISAGNWNVSSEISVDDGSFTAGTYTFKFDPSGSTGAKGYTEITLTIPVEDSEPLVKTLYVYYPKGADGQYLKYAEGDHAGEYIPVIFSLQMSQNFKIDVENVWDDLCIPGTNNLYVHVSDNEHGFLLDYSGSDKKDVFIIDMNGNTTFNITPFDEGSSSGAVYYVISDKEDLLTSSEWEQLHSNDQEEPEQTEMVAETMIENDLSDVPLDEVDVPVSDVSNKETEESIEAEETIIEEIISEETDSEEISETVEAPNEESVETLPEETNE